jgi:hypothetical protein
VSLVSRAQSLIQNAAQLNAQTPREFPLSLLLLVGGGDSLFAELGLDLSRELQAIIQQVSLFETPNKVGAERH